MAKLYLMLFGTIIFTGVVLLLLLLFRYASVHSHSAHPLKAVVQLEVHQNPSATQPEGWVGRLSDTKHPEFVYPFSEISIELPLKKQVPIMQRYRILFSELDPYRLFCIRQTLNQNGIDFQMDARGDHAVIVINNLSKGQVSELKRILDGYRLNYQIETYIKE